MSAPLGKMPELLNLNKLAWFTPFETLSNHQLGVLLESLEILSIKTGEKIIALGDATKTDFFLLSGELKLTASDGKENTLTAESDKAKSPIAHLRPSLYDVTALEDSSVILISPEVMEKVEADNLEAAQAETYEVIDQGQDTSERTNLIFKFNQLLNQEECALPSLPDLAMRIRKAVADENTSMADIANIIQMDPPITAKLIKVANSAVYPSASPADSCLKAINRIGTRATVQMVVTFTMKELFRMESPMLKKRMKELWQQRCEVAAISFFLARATPGMDPEEAMLAGLLHDIGIIPILTLSSQYPEIMEDPSHLDEILDALRGEFSATMLRKWNFPDELVLAAAESEDWMRDHDEQPDLADLVLVAQLHSYVGKPRQKLLPKLDEVPAFTKMASGKMTPQASLKLIEKSKKQIEHTKRLLMS